MNMYLPRFEGSDRCDVGFASCFALLRGRGIVQETIDLRVEGLVEDEAGHLCNLVYECKTRTRN